ncbi:hypothetical protein TNCV_2731941 [Trichonephila clavipes]|nr:hypothetical protein TNCV_2731941 [Trichonephila clavipes]
MDTDPPASGETRFGCHVRWRMSLEHSNLCTLTCAPDLPECTVLDSIRPSPVAVVCSDQPSSCSWIPTHSLLVLSSPTAEAFFALLRKSQTRRKTSDVA